MLPTAVGLGYSRSMSIKRKLTLMMMSISLAAVMLTVLAITAYLIYDMHKSTVAQLGVTAALTGDRNSAALVFLDNERANHNLEIFRLNPSILTACIYDAHGVLFAGYRNENAAGSTCPSDMQHVRTIMPNIFTALEDIKQNGEKVGTVFMVSDTHEIDNYVQKIVQISIAAILLVLGVTALLTVYFQRTVSAPILELAATAQSITANRDYTLEAKAVYHDETGILARAFNDMLGEVRARDRELLQTNETLEHKVVERTRQLEEAKQRAEHANEAKSEFLRNMSHEFRTPLHAILSFSTYGIKEYEAAAPSQLKHYFELIQTGTERLSRLVNEVLDLAKLEQGEHRFLLQRVDMRALITRAVDMMRPLLQEKNLTLRFAPPAEPMPVLCDHDKIVQVMTNLLGNAIKFTPAGMGITLSLHSAGAENNRQAVVSVMDEGIGIPEKERETIFESFRQSSRTNQGAGGTGLGLSICRGIVDAHGGEIWAENNSQGPGACVTFRLPAALEQQDHLVFIHKKEARHENAA